SFGTRQGGSKSVPYVCCYASPPNCKLRPQGHDIYVIPIVYYEFIRGFRYTNNLQMLHNATQFWSTLPYYEATKAIWDEASQLWVMTKRLNKMPGDKDIFIAAFAIHLNAIVVTRLLYFGRR